MTVWTCARHRDAGVASVAALLLLAVATDAGAFRIAVERVVGVGVHAAIEPPPATPSFDQTDPAAIAALLAGIDFTEQADCSEYGMAPEAVAYLAFADGAVERYELLSGYEYLARPGLPARACVYARLRRQPATSTWPGRDCLGRATPSRTRPATSSAR